MLNLNSPIESLEGIPDILRIPLINRLRIRRVADLIFHFPRSYQAPAAEMSAEDFEANIQVSVVGQVLELDQRYTQSGKHMLGVLLQVEPSRTVRLMWFNQGFRAKHFRVGQTLRASGKLKSTGLNWEMVHPDYAVLEGDEDESDFDRPRPIYPLCEGIKQPQLRKLMKDCLPDAIPSVREVLPERIRMQLDVMEIQAALTALHFPENENEAQAALRRFKLQELFVLQLAIALQKNERDELNEAPVCEPSGKVHSRILNRLGVMLTFDQTRAIEEIGADMAKTVPMNRLLQGDVGSGKTVVAQYAMLLSAAHGYQAALMVPTEVLAHQHAQTFRESLSSSRVNVGLLTGAMSAAKRRDMLAAIAEGELDLVVGTQALLSEDVEFANLGLVIVDEQHKFGVMQRAKLRSDGKQPHYLLLSATPIPRTIAMTMFGDLDVSCIREKPPGRAKVHTYLAENEDLDSWWRFVEQKIKDGRQAFIIAPRVSKSEDEGIANVEETFSRLSQGRFSHLRMGLLHGRVPTEAKAAILQEFASGKIDILVATTVVEVGINVPNATVMTILNAEILGLAQLHQLRGRVGRGTHGGYVCAVQADGKVGENPRLEAFKQTDDGFELAEMDLRIRGAGDLLGTVQSGLPSFRVADLGEDQDLIEVARKVAFELVATDPRLAAEDLALLKEQTLARYGKSMQLSGV